MKTKHIFSLLMACLLFGLGTLQAQTPDNRLSSPGIQSGAGKVAGVPVHLTNSDEIVAVQLTLTLPSGFTIPDTTRMVLSDRKVNHTVSVKSLGYNDYLFVIYSSTNTPLRGNSGLLLQIPVAVPDTCTEGTRPVFSFKQVILSNREGANVMTLATGGQIEIIRSPRPDVVVEQLTFDKSTLTPGEAITLSWQVSNQGDLGTASGWSEQLFLVADNGESTLLGTLYYDGLLQPEEQVGRQATLNLSASPGVDGPVKAMVRILPNAALGELPAAAHNNIIKSQNYLEVSKLLNLKLNRTRISENDYSSIQCQLQRSGSRAAEMFFTLTAIPTGRLEIPSQVRIPAGQGGAVFYIRTIDNQVLNPDSLVTLLLTGNNYPNVSQVIQIDDNEVPRLTLTPSVTEVVEGGAFTFTLTREGPTTRAISVKLTSDYPKRFSYPAEVPMAVGVSSVNVNVAVIDDAIPYLDITANFTADALGYSKGMASLFLPDDDVPPITLTIAPTTVSESAGYQAAVVTVKRQGSTDQTLYVRMSDNSAGTLYYSTPTVTLEKGVAQKQFTVGIVDNALVDGTRTYNVTAAVFINSCNCAVAQGSAGHVKTDLIVADDDGPALKIVSSQTMLPEGKTAATVLTITRNTPAIDDLSIVLSSNRDEKLQYTKNLVIPTGKTSVSTSVDVLANLIAEGDQTVTFTATATNYSSGFCWAMITDQTLADAVIRIQSLSADTLLTRDTLTVLLKIENPGLTTLTMGKSVDLYLSRTDRLGNDKVLLAATSTPRNIPAGGSDTLRMGVRLPDVTGLRYVIADVNAQQTQKELSYLNNQSDGKALVLLPMYSVTLSTDKALYLTTDTVRFSGKALAGGLLPVPDAEVEIYYIQNNTRQTLKATTNENGDFSARLAPSPAVLGKFIAGACYPGEALTKELTTFEVLGMKRTATNHLIWEVLNGIIATFEVELLNPGTRPLTNIRVERLDGPTAFSFTYDPIATIAAGGKVMLKMYITATAATVGSQYERLQFRLRSTEGAQLDQLVFYYCRDPRATLKPSISNIRTTMTKGSTRQYEFSISNNGQGESGNISVVIPNTPWLSLLTPATLPSLAYNESSTVILQLTPTPDMAVNAPVTGTIGVNCVNGNGFSMPFNIETVSESTGKLIVEVSDEYTYYTAEAPRVVGAKVKLRHPYTKALVMEGVTDSTGRFTVDSLPEGYYYMEVTATQHDGYANNILVDPGKTTFQPINLSFQAITISWEVVETEVVDEYSIETVVKFETNVPTPVVEMIVPREIDTEKLLVGESMIFNVILTNKGLITAKDVAITLPSGFHSFTFEPLFNTIDLKPQESVMIPVTLTKVSQPNSVPAFGAPAAWNEPCDDYIVVIYFWDCGLDRKWHQYPQRINLGKWCFGTGTPSTGWSPGGGGIPWGPSGPGGGGYYYPDADDHTPSVSVSDCEPCQNRWLLKMSLCLFKRIPAIDKALKIAKGIICAKNIVGFGDFSCLTDYIPTGPYEYVELYKECVKPLLEKCVPGDFGLEDVKSAYPVEVDYYEYPAHTERYRQVLMQATNAANSFEEHFLEIYGDSIWLQLTGDELYPFAQKVWSYEGVIPVDDPLLRALKPDTIPEALYQLFIQRMNNTKQKLTTGGNYVNIDTLNAIQARKLAAEEFATENGYESVDEMLQVETDILEEKLEESEGSVCATITIKFSQTMTLTRQAFRGTLTVFNGHETRPMEEVELNLIITDPQGNVAGTQLFQVNTESLNKFSAIDGTGMLGAQETGEAVILFIPTKHAAPELPIDYSFGGTLTYKDPFTGTVVTRDLFPVTLTVKPSPDLWLSYFMQRDVLGDDPLTKDIVEPSVDAEFSLLIHNRGAGEATNVKLASRQPEIVENEKGLLITFEITGSSLNGAEKNIGMTNIDFGNIPSTKTAYGQWYLRSSLLGHFVDYDVSYTHVTSYGNPDLSLVSDVNIHELIRTIQVLAESATLRGWLVNDVVDSDDYPDMLYTSDGTTAEVSTTGVGLFTKVSDTQYRLTVTPEVQGWNYLCLPDPGNGTLTLLTALRESDQTTLPKANVWQTDRTLRDGKDPLYENRLHWSDRVMSDEESYLLTFEVKRLNVLAVAGFSGVPAGPSDTAVLKLKVQFTQDVDPATFNYEDLQLNIEGVRQDLSTVGIRQLTAREFEIDLSTVTTRSGYYVFTVQTHDILDMEAYPGAVGKTVAWHQFLGEMIEVKVDILPAGAGTVAPTTTQFPYGVMMTFTATPTTGYKFSSWKEGPTVLGTTRELVYTPRENTILQAHFTTMNCQVGVSWNTARGTVTGNSSGIYLLGSTIYLTALPGSKFDFSGWMINGVFHEMGNTLELSVDADLQIEAVFVDKDYTGIEEVMLSEEGTVWVFPNPARNGQPIQLRINFSDEELHQSRLLVYSMLGALIQEAGPLHQEMQVSELNRGMYIVCVQKANGSMKRIKLIVE